MSKNPIFSVLMAAHNEEANIQRAIESYLAQDFSDTELIIVDDGSTDDTGVIADEYEKQHPEITVIHREASGAASPDNESYGCRCYLRISCESEDIRLMVLHPAALKLTAGVCSDMRKNR